MDNHRVQTSTCHISVQLSLVDNHIAQSQGCMYSETSLELNIGKLDKTPVNISKSILKT